MACLSCPGTDGMSALPWYRDGMSELPWYRDGMSELPWYRDGMSELPWYRDGMSELPWYRDGMSELPWYRDGMSELPWYRDGMSELPWYRDGMSELPWYRDGMSELPWYRDGMSELPWYRWHVCAALRKLPNKLSDLLITSTVGKSSSIQCNADLRHLFNEILDRQISELNSRFQEYVHGMMKASADCWPTSETFGQRESLQPTCSLYGINVEDAEFTVFVQQLNLKVVEGKSYPSLIKVFDNCNLDIFPNVNVLLRAQITLPMTTCSVEKFFSTTNRIKTATRASMLTSRLNNLSLLSFERELCDSLDYDSIIALFNSKPRCLVI
ncbi:UNVERIFIED_CONTAM: hypothetical protein FKN15_062794 [Acipenser sinensis]